MSEIKNKVVWITGATSGIGKALAFQMAAEGASLILSARREDELQKIKAELKLAEEKILPLAFDLGDTQNINTLAEKAIQKFGKIDLLINNGGVSQRGLTKDTSIEIDRKIMEVNYFGTVALTKAVLPQMLKQKSGHIVVISSIAGKFGFFLRSAYSASKHALHGFFESLRLEILNDNIQVTIVCPGKIQTNISVNALTENGEKHNKMDASQAKGITAERCAKEIIQAIKNNKEEILIGGKELMAVHVKRFFPNLFSRIIRTQKPE